MTDACSTFTKHVIARPPSFFQQLKESVSFERLCQGRDAAVLVRPTDSGEVPIVRTTSAYQHGPHRFNDIHHEIVRDVRETCGVPALDFNNAMLELYTTRYRTMRYHTDQAQDLQPDSHVAIYSCYKDEGVAAPRVLCIKNKETCESWRVPMEHHSVILFSLSTNQRHVHKIVLDRVSASQGAADDEQWLGLTMRLSKTFVKFSNDAIPTIDGSALRMASDEERSEFYRLRREENSSVAHVYPPLAFTISPSDLMPPSQ